MNFDSVIVLNLINIELTWAE